MEASADRRDLLNAEWFTLGDGARLRWYRWPAVGAEDRGVLLVLNGRSEFLEKWDETARDFAALGFDVFSLDWRGQGLSTRPLPGTDKGYIDRFETYLDDLEAFLDAVVAPAAGGRPIVMVAHSMGGHIALRFLADRHPPVRAAVLAAPMINFRTGPLHRAVVHSMAWLATRIGLGDRYTLGGGPFDPAREPFDGNVLTGDPDRYQVRMDYFATYPELRVGAVTIGWLDAAFRSVNKMAAKGYLECIGMPVLIGQAGQEALVDNRAMASAVDRMPDARLLVFDDARHELFMEQDAVRASLMEAVDRFFADRGI
ncbi:MAG: alpha/beta hydrolase [Pseudomonadota bacterium]